MKVYIFNLKIITCIILVMQVISIMSLQGQDYFISFNGTGASATVDSVKIENLAQGTKLKMKGSDVLHLMGTTGIETITGDETGNIAFYPNPMKDNAKLRFDLPETSRTVITLFDLSGKEMVRVSDLLSKGRHIYGIQGIENGIYFVRVSSGRYSYIGKLMCTGSESRAIKLVHENTLTVQEKQKDTKGTSEEIVMQYTVGDRLLMKGISTIHSTIVTDVPTGSKTITFSFVPCTDADGNNYPVVVIPTTKKNEDSFGTTEGKGGMTFMGENLKVTKLNDDTPIPLVTSPTEWSQKESPAYCWYLNQVSYINVFGAYYNWYTVNTGKLCPAGWHVPTFSDFMYLREILGGAEEAGGKLKETGIDYWKSPNTGASNSAGFTALPAGYRDSNGSFPAMESYGMWWSSSPSYISCSTGAWYMYLYYNDQELMIAEKCLSTTGFSVRCLKD